MQGRPKPSPENQASRAAALNMAVPAPVTCPRTPGRPEPACSPHEQRSCAVHPDAPASRGQPAPLRRSPGHVTTSCTAVLVLNQLALEDEFLDLAERGAGHLGDEVPADRHLEAGKVLLAQRPQAGRVG